MTSAYNRWCQHFFTFNLPRIGCLTIVQNYIDIRLLLLEIWRGGGWVQIEPLPENTIIKSPSLIKIKLSASKNFILLQSYQKVYTIWKPTKYFWLKLSVEKQSCVYQIALNFSFELTVFVNGFVYVSSQ